MIEERNDGIAIPHPLWSSPPKPLMLPEEEVHVWGAVLDAPVAYVEQLRLVLSDDELRRAEHLVFEKDRYRFIIARGILRTLLGRYLEMEPSKLRFVYSPYGKPALASNPSTEILRFNLSHSGQIVLYAFARKRAVGIDIEQVRTDIEYEQIAAHVLSPYEQHSLRNVLSAQKARAFFNCWTRKEAYIKARGEGLSLPLTQFDVSLAPGDPARLLATRDDPPEASRWSLQELTSVPGYVAALAVAGHDYHHRCWWWQEYWDRSSSGRASAPTTGGATG